MVLDDGAPGVLVAGFEDVPVRRGGLPHGGREGERHDGVTLAVVDPVWQGERQREARLATAGRDR